MLFALAIPNKKYKFDDYDYDSKNKYIIYNVLNILLNIIIVQIYNLKIKNTN